MQTLVTHVARRRPRPRPGPVGVGGVVALLLLARSSTSTTTTPVRCSSRRILHGAGGGVGGGFVASPPPPPAAAASSAGRLLQRRRFSTSSNGSDNDAGLALRTVVPVDALPPARRLRHGDGLVLIGSCFSENMGAILLDAKYRVETNPFGILYNPVSLQRCVARLLEGRPYELGELDHQPGGGGKYFSFDHHTSFSHADPAQALAGINARLGAGREALLGARHLFLTLGTAHTYVHREQGGRVVANCHKLPQSLFDRELLGVPAIVSALTDIVTRVRAANPGVGITFTVSPVRHLRNAQGPVQNARSKAHLLTAVHEVVEQQQQQGVTYFPAYEIMMDDLRDYRYYNDDLLHPSPLAVDYIWRRLAVAYLDDSPAARQLRKELASLRSALAHRPFDPASDAHQAFLKKQLEAIAGLRARHPCLDLDAEERQLRAALTD